MTKLNFTCAALKFNLFDLNLIPSAMQDSAITIQSALKNCQNIYISFL
jgi:hypothetical protein